MNTTLDEYFSDIEVASKRIREYVHTTPVLTSQSLNDESGLELYFKAENTQKTGSFKARGAINAVLAALDRHKTINGFVTGSCGNHGAALAYICSQLNPALPCIVVVVKDCPKVKINAIQRYGGQIIFTEGQNMNVRDRKAENIARERNFVYVSSCDSKNVITGQGTVGMELLRKVPDLDAILVPISGGGLAAGVALAAAKLSPECKVIGVEPLKKNLSLCLKTKTRLWPTPPEYLRTKAEGLQRQQVGHMNFPILCNFLEPETMVVSDDQMTMGAKLAFERLKAAVELSGGAAIAAAMSPKFKEKFPGVKRVGVILCGGNVSLDTLASKLKGLDFADSRLNSMSSSYTY